MVLQRCVRFSGFLALLLLMPSSSPATPQANDETVLRTQQDEAGRDLELRVSQKRLAATKPWVPEREQPPLGIQAAVTAAKKRVKPTRPADLQVIDIQLSAINVGATSNPASDFRWYYVIEMYDVAEARGPSPPSTKEVVVLMDGSVVTPIVAAVRK